MEGICGIISFDGPIDNPSQTINEMVNALSDGESLSISRVTGKDWALACAHWKEGHWRPMTFIYQNDGIAIVGIADIHNLPDLVAEHRVPPANTGAVVAALFLSDPERWAQQIRGNFAVIILDSKDHRFFVATDRVGVRPVYWHERGGAYYLCSRIKGIHRLCRSFEIDDGAIYAYMQHGMIPSPRTIYKGVQKLEPGFFLKADRTRHSLIRYWDITNMPKLAEREEEIADRVYRCIDNAVLLMKDGIGQDSDLACFLSGGTDSSSICGLLSRSSDVPVKAYTVGFSEANYNEMVYARTAARRFGLTLREIYLRPKDAVELLPYIIRAYDEPLGNMSVVPALYCVQSAARDGVLYMLAGDGGDEIFAGNAWYAEQQLFREYYRIPRFIRDYLVEPLVTNRLERLPFWVFRKAGSYIRRAKMCDIDRLYSYKYAADEEIFDPGFLSRCKGESIVDIARMHFDRLPDAAPLDRTLYHDMKLVCTDNDLRKVTRMCDVAHVRVRYPMLDHPVIDLGFHIPASLKLKGTSNLRYIFKQAFLDLLPQKILKKRKQGFGVPLARWLRTEPRMKEFAFRLLFDERYSGRGYFRPGFVRMLWDMNLNAKNDMYGYMLWDLVMLEAWHLQHVENEPLPL